MGKSEYTQALESAKKLSDLSDDYLLVELGTRIQDMQNMGGYQRAQEFDANYSQVAEEMLSVEDLKKIGLRWWKKLEKEMMQLVCDPNNEERGKITGGKTIPEIAASLATSAVVAAFGPPSWVIVATTILATKVVETGLDTLCEVWGESLS